MAPELIVDDEFDSKQLHWQMVCIYSEHSCSREEHQLVASPTRTDRPSLSTLTSAAHQDTQQLCRNGGCPLPDAQTGRGCQLSTRYLHGAQTFARIAGKLQRHRALDPDLHDICRDNTTTVHTLGPFEWLTPTCLLLCCHYVQQWLDVDDTANLAVLIHAPSFQW